MNDNLKISILIVILAMQMIGFVSSLVAQFPAGSGNKRQNCEYTTIASVTNIGYIVTCELLRQRFSVGK